jgi:hypothetical protein
LKEEIQAMADKELSGIEKWREDIKEGAGKAGSTKEDDSANGEQDQRSREQQKLADLTRSRR